MILKDIRINSIQTSETTLTLKSESIYRLKLLKEKIRSITFIVWMLARVEKIVNKQGQNNEKTYFLFKQISKCDKCFYIHFSKALKKYSLQICSFSCKKLWAILEFFFPNWTFSALYSTLCVKKKLRNVSANVRQAAQSLVQTIRHPCFSVNDLKDDILTVFLIGNLFLLSYKI